MEKLVFRAFWEFTCALFCEFMLSVFAISSILVSFRRIQSASEYHESTYLHWNYIKFELSLPLSRYSSPTIHLRRARPENTTRLDGSDSGQSRWHSTRIIVINSEISAKSIWHLRARMTRIMSIVLGRSLQFIELISYRVARSATLVSLSLSDSFPFNPSHSNASFQID